MVPWILTPIVMRLLHESAMTLRRSADVSLSALLAISEEISRNVVIALVRIHLKVGTSWRKLKTMMRNV
jgi:hypothetical protein